MSVRPAWAPFRERYYGSHGHGGAYGTQAWIDPQKGGIFVLMVQRSNFPNSDGSDIRAAFQAAAVESLGKR